MQHPEFHFGQLSLSIEERRIYYTSEEHQRTCQPPSLLSDLLSSVMSSSHVRGIVKSGALQASQTAYMHRLSAHHF